MNSSSNLAQLRISRFLFSDARLAWLWLVVRLYVGYEWLTAGWEKFVGTGWVGSSAGSVVKGFLTGALQKVSGAHPDVSGWYGSFIQNFALPHAAQFSYFIAYGEILVGIALLIGAFTGLAAFFGAFMNLNYLLAGTVSTNPQLLILGVFLVLAWRTAGLIGVDRWLLPNLAKRR